MKKKISKLSIKKTSVASFNAHNVKGGSVLCANTEDNMSCADQCPPTDNLVCNQTASPDCQTNICYPTRLC